MPIVQSGSINTTALIVPDLYVQIVPPQVRLLNGVPTDVIGVVGTASWGPVNSPTIVGDMDSYSRQFGPIKNRKYDAGTIIATAVQQGAQNFRVVRVTDGTDVAAAIVVLTNCITFTSKYTGSMGNNLQVTIANGSAANSYKVTVAMPGFVPEVFDNITGSGNALWVAIAAAINSGQSGLRGPSDMIVATAGAGTTTPTLTTYNLANGADGDAVDKTDMIGVDTVPRSGMYALRNSGASICVLSDLDDTTTFSDQVTFGLAEGMYMIGVIPAGTSISSAVSGKSGAGIDSYAFKYMHGDWIYWLDTVNGVTRLVSPQGFVAGKLGNMSPEQSTLNKQLYGIVGTQKSSANQKYSQAELQTLIQAGIDVICNPAPGGSYFAVRAGHNSSSNAVINGDNYTRMTNYIASTLNAGMGQYVGMLQNADTRREAKATLEAFFTALDTQGMIGDPNGGPSFNVVLDASNNPSDRVALGYMQADCKVKYLAIVEKFIVNLEGGTSVKIDRISTQPNG